MGIASNVILRDVNSGGVAAAVRQCMELCNWREIIAPGAPVMLKPNLCTAVADKWEMSNTDPRVTEAVCEVLRERTDDIYIVESDGLRQTAWEAFEVSGYYELADRVGAELVNLSESALVEVDVPPAGKVQLPKMLLRGDALITLPVLKTHALTHFTGAIKNQWGCVPQYDRILLHQYLNKMLPMLHKVLHPCMAVMDAIVCMEGRGPANGKARRMDLVLASRDAVALDSTAMRLVTLNPIACEHVIGTAELGLGAWRTEQIEVDGEFEKYCTQFEPAVLDKAVAAMNYMSRYRWFVKYFLERDFVFYPIRAAVKGARALGILAGGR